MGTSQDKSVWNWLEVSKLIVGALTPLTVCVVAFLLNSSLKTAEMRAAIYKELGGHLNEIHSYTTFVGRWKELTPVEVVERKRRTDALMHTYRPFFSPQLFERYNVFIKLTFEEWGKPGTDARIRSAVKGPDGNRSLHAKGPWDCAWDERFTGERLHDQQREAYDAFLKQLASDLRL